MPACTQLCCSFRSVLDQHLLSWLEEYPWTKVEIALGWLTLLLRYNGSVEPPWWHHISSGSSCNNPGISWLWNVHYNIASWRQFFHFLLDFLQCPNRCGHLSIGKASTTSHFAHLSAQIDLNNCLGSTNSLNLRYLVAFSFLLLLLNTQMTCLCKLSSLPS